MKGKYQKVLLSSGIEVFVKSMPSGLWFKTNRAALTQYPDPEIPTKTIKVVDGEETIENPQDEKYLEEVGEVETSRAEILANIILDICVSFTLTSEHEDIIKIIESTLNEKFPKNKKERTKEFLLTYALADQGDYTLVYTLAQEQMIVSDAEVQDRINSFRGQMAWSGYSQTEASSNNGKQQLDIRSKVKKS